jgi:hypothetical protein
MKWIKQLNYYYINLLKIIPLILNIKKKFWIINKLLGL